jgi:Holliday junction resolvase RusA-like endonuclease
MKITLPLPTSINRTYRSGNGHYWKSDEARIWEAKAMYVYTKQAKNIKPVEGNVLLEIKFFLKRDRDIDSGLKILLDFLQGRFYGNDRQVQELDVVKFMDKENPRVEVRIV